MADEQIELRGALADEEAAMRSGKASSLLVMGLLAVAVLGGLVYLVGGEDEARVYGDLGRAINGLRQSSFDQFWGCALQSEDLRDVQSNTALIDKLDGRSRERGRAYGIHLRDACLPLLEPVGPKLDTLIVPPDMSESIKGLKEANDKLRSAVSGLVSYLDDPDLEYDEAVAHPHHEAIARGWYEFKKASGALNDVIRDKVK